MVDSILGAARGVAAPAMELLCRGRAPRPFAIHRCGITVESASPVDVVVARLTFAPGDASSWRFHPGPMLTVLKGGSLTRYAAEESDARTYRSGVAFAENSPHGGTMVRNEGPVETEAIVVLLAPSFPLPRSTA